MFHIDSSINLPNYCQDWISLEILWINFNIKYEMVKHYNTKHMEHVQHLVINIIWIAVISKMFM